MENKHTRSVSLIDGHTEKMTDAEIIKALECCKMPVGSGACNNCPLKVIRDNLHKEDTKSCTTIMMENALDLIKRQQAEIERLKELATP
jgi:hypothetical protein